MSTPSGKIRHYQTTTNFGLHILGLYPVWGNASLNGTVNQFTQNALKERANSVNIIQKDMTRLYLLLPPLTLIFMPVVTEVFGEVY
ncbi:MAG TPA: hypothetical protein PL163_07510 [Leptospiraceae bacterium]|nr:hypothetical protein [Leptospiraceae bacterium]